MVLKDLNKKYVYSKDVVSQVEGLNTEKTFVRWRKMVEEIVGDGYFAYEYIKKRKVIVYSEEDIQRFQNVSYLLQKQPSDRKNLKEAITIAFSSDLVVFKEKSDLEKLEEKLILRLDELSEENERLWKLNKILHFQIKSALDSLKRVNDLIEIARENKPKLFEKKKKSYWRVGG